MPRLMPVHLPHAPGHAARALDTALNARGPLFTSSDHRSDRIAGELQ